MTCDITFRRCDSETDTEEFEQVGQLERRQVSTSTTDVTETVSMSTSTLEVAMRNVETITEVRHSHSTHIEHSDLKRPLTYNSIVGTVTNKIPPKKPPRVPSKTTMPLHKSKSDTLPSIPEMHSPDIIPKKSIYRSSDASSDDVSSAGHHNNCPNAMTSDIYPHQSDSSPIDGEFIHSEFYIDESLPSSLTDDSEPPDGQLKYDTSSDDLRYSEMNGSSHGDGRKCNYDLFVEQLISRCDDANGAVIHLLQVLHQIEIFVIEII